MYSFSWVIGCGENAQGGNTYDVQQERVMEVLELILNSSGSITLDIVDGDEIGAESLQVQSEGGESVISLGEYIGDDYVVRGFSNKSAGVEKISILGDEWDSKLVCDDQKTVKQIVIEFLSTGSVSSEYLS